MVFAEIFLFRRRYPAIIAKFPKAKNYTDGEPCLMLKFSKQMSIEKIYLAETKGENKVRIPINSSTESRRIPCLGANASCCMASARKRVCK